jgi:hypothetical protein
MTAERGELPRPNYKYRRTFREHDALHEQTSQYQHKKKAAHEDITPFDDQRVLDGSMGPIADWVENFIDIEYSIMRSICGG